MMKAKKWRALGAARAIRTTAMVVLASSITWAEGGTVYADEDLKQWQGPLVFSFEVFDDESVDAAWGSEVDVITYDHEQLEAAQILLPPSLAAKVNEAFEGKGLDATGGLLEVVIFIEGSVSGTRCHYYEPGRRHCHSTE